MRKRLLSIDSTCSTVRQGRLPDGFVSQDSNHRRCEPMQEPLCCRQHHGCAQRCSAFWTVASSGEAAAVVSEKHPVMFLAITGNETDRLALNLTRSVDGPSMGLEPGRSTIREGRR